MHQGKDKGQKILRTNVKDHKNKNKERFDNVAVRRKTIMQADNDRARHWKKTLDLEYEKIHSVESMKKRNSILKTEENKLKRHDQ